MNRLTRIALTLFFSATLLLVLARLRLEKAGELDPESMAEVIQQETRMGYLAVIMAGVMMLAGTVLVVVRLVRARRRQP